MDISTVLAAAPWLKKAWRLVPGPLRIPLVVAAAVVWLWKRRGDRELEARDAAAA